jgi:hypothetical protein
MVFLMIVPPVFAWSLESNRPYPMNHHFAFLLVGTPLVACVVLSSKLKSP